MGYNGPTGSRVIRRTCQLFDGNPEEDCRYGDSVIVSIREAVLAKKIAEQGAEQKGPPPPPQEAKKIVAAMKAQLDGGAAPPPGEGPPPETRTQYYSDVYAVGQGEDGRWASVHYCGPEAYEVTAMCSVTAALIIVDEPDKVKTKQRAGVVTPAFALDGSTWIQRLQDHTFANGKGRKMAFTVQDGVPSEDTVKDVIRAKTKNAMMGEA